MKKTADILSSIDRDYLLDPALKGAEGFIISPSFFSRAAKAFKSEGYRLSAEWAVDESPFGRGFSVCASYSLHASHVVIKAPLEGQGFQSLSKVYPAAVRMERQISSLFGLTPEGLSDARPWIKHEDWPAEAYPLRKSFDAATVLPRVSGEYDWVRAEGEGVYEIPVGPVHAGIIEPGHFRFQAAGEDVINLETRFGYVHKGIEKRFESLGWTEAARLAGRVSGDSTVAHAAAFSMAVEAAACAAAPQRAMYIRAVMMELERIANHLGDIGAICNDTAFAFLFHRFLILREKVLKSNGRLFGHRLVMDRVAPGGVTTDITKAGAEELTRELDSIEPEFERLVMIYEDNPSIEDRVWDTGVLHADLAEAIGAVGYVARASGQRRDARLDYPVAPYLRHAPRVPVLSSGDVHARAWVRVEEVRASIQLIKALLKDMPEGPLSVPFNGPEPGACGFAAAEGFRGEILYWVQAGPDGGINRCMVRDPSTMNWIAIEYAIKGNIVPDFPLCNKSFNQSYSGHDL